MRAPPSPDLLWALRGGSGDFGVVTALEFDPSPISKVYGGTLSFPFERAREILAIVRGADGGRRRAVDDLAHAHPRSEPASVRRQAGGQCRPAELVRPWRDAGAAHGELKTLPTSEIGTIEGAPPAGLESVEAYVPRNAEKQLITLDRRTGRDPWKPLADYFEERAHPDRRFQVSMGYDPEFSLQLGHRARQSPGEVEIVIAEMTRKKRQTDAGSPPRTG